MLAALGDCSEKHDPLAHGKHETHPPLVRKKEFRLDDDDELMLNVLRCHLTY